MTEFLGLCYSCRDQLHYQFNGHTPGWDSLQVQQEYISKYVALKLPVIKCYNCEARVRYLEDENGVWHELRQQRTLTFKLREAK